MIPRESARCASIGCDAPSICHNMRRDMATDTGAVLSAISRAISRAVFMRSSPECTLRTSPPDNASSAPKTRPVYTHSVACAIPTRRGKKYEEHASGTMPRFAKTNPNFAVSLARRKSMGRVIVTPTPTAGPLITPITGFLLLKIRKETNPPPSRGTPCFV